MWRRLLDSAVVLLILMQVWQWWPIASEEYAEPDDTMALFAQVEAARTSTAPQYLESELSLTESDLTFASSSDALSLPTLYQQAKQSTVIIVGYDEWDDQILGAGVVLTNTGVIVTNEHIVTDLTELYIILPDEEAVLPVTSILYTDQGQDLALLQVDADTLTPVRLSREEPAIGDAVAVLGHPELFLYSLSAGIVSGQRTYSQKGGRFLQMTAAVNYGNSGGPVFNQAGALIGLVSWSLEYDQNVQNVEGLHFAIPTAEITKLFNN